MPFDKKKAGKKLHALLNRAKKYPATDKPPKCPVCGKPIEDWDEEMEYVQTRGGTEYWIHAACVDAWTW